jgi:hypothetical protein
MKIRSDGEKISDLQVRLSRLEDSTRYELDSDEAMICKLIGRLDELESSLDEIRSIIEKQ